MIIEGLQRGEKLILECEGEQYLATVSIASSNGRSLVVLFNAMIDGHVGMMPVTTTKAGEYASLITGKPITLRRPETPEETARLRRNEK